MKIQTIRQRLLHSTMIGGAALMALTAVPAVALLAMPAVAAAQDYTSGSLLGTVADPSGAPVAGAEVTITSQEQGFSRRTTTNGSGEFRYSLVPVGNYTVVINAAGFEPANEEDIGVRLGGQSAYAFTLGSADGATNVEDVVVTASRPSLDFSQTTSGVTVDLAELVEQVPLARNITAVTLLAPGAVSGSPAFGAQASIGGSSVAENSFYINGLNITNFDTYVGGTPVPFEFYRNVEIKTGGVPAEFGRAAGGVINAVSKSGSNDLTVELHGTFAPNFLREDIPDTYQNANRFDYNQSYAITAEIGGPIIPDRLFAYGLYQWQESEIGDSSISASQRTVSTNDDPVFGIKLDGYLTDNHHLEFTYFDTTQEQLNTFYGFSNASGQTGTTPTGTSISSAGGENFVFRYTGSLTDFLTVSAAYGVNKDSSSVAAADTAAPYVVDQRSGTPLRIGPQTSLSSDLNTTEREFYRFDVDYLLDDFIGDHHFRGGMDNEDTTLSHSTVLNGGYYVTYNAGDDVYAPAGQEYADVYYQTFGGRPVTGNNRAFYIQDSWDVTSDLNLQLGMRYDQFTMNNLQGAEVITLDDNWGPRAAFNYDVAGDGRQRLYGSFGRYFIPVASNLSYRGADIYVHAYMLPAGGAATFTLDPVTGLPVGGFGAPAVEGTAPAPDGATLDACPSFILFGAAGADACEVAGDGSQEPPESKYAYGTRATLEDEFSLGYEYRVNDLWTVGARAVHRVLDRTSEDTTVDRLVNQYCADNGMVCDAPYTVGGVTYPGYFGDRDYIILNPGGDLTFLVRDPLPNGQRPVLTFSADEVDLPKPEREYTALELTFERAFDGVWSLQGSYVGSRSIGNYEGTVLSDGINGQDDAGSTILYDHPGLTDNTYGLLPNHRGHQFKLFGMYQLTDAFSVGANLAVTSPKKYGCRGRHPTDSGAQGYGANSFYCQGRPTPRGSVFESDWTPQFDMQFRYQLPSFGGWMPENVSLRADVFNVFNSQSVIDRVEQGDLNGGAVNPNYQKPVRYQTPRYVRFSFDMKF